MGLLIETLVNFTRIDMVDENSKNIISEDLGKQKSNK